MSFHDVASFKAFNSLLCEYRVLITDESFSQNYKNKTQAVKNPTTALLRNDSSSDIFEPEHIVSVTVDLGNLPAGVDEVVLSVGEWVWPYP